MPKAVKKAPRKKVNGYKLPEPLPNGEILQDVAKNSWVLGPSIGKGGFGEIYSARMFNSPANKYPYVIKIEPHSNGPLFVEMHFYMRNGKPNEIADYKKEKGFTTFGMPMFYGSGSHDYNGEKFRFVVMEKFGSDIWKLFKENKRTFPTATVFKLAIQILDVLEYIHSHGYVHADIKGANILMGITKETENRQVYLVDFGLATKFTTAKEFKTDPKKAHDGTIEYLSRDAHKGVPTRRGDLEILAYNMIQWLGCTLPWEYDLTSPNTVQQSKEAHMESASQLISSCFKTKKCPAAMSEFLTYLLTIDFNKEPDYKKIRAIFMSGIKEAGGTLDSPLEFSVTNKRASLKRTSVKLLVAPKKKRKIITSEAEGGMNGSSVGKEPVKKRLGRPRKAVKADNNDDDKLVDVVVKKSKAKVAAKKTVQSAQSPEVVYTEAMKEVAEKMKKAKMIVTMRKNNLKTQLDDSENGTDDMQGYTESMKEIKLKKLAKSAAKLPQAKQTDNSIPTTSKTASKVVKKPVRTRRNQPVLVVSDSE